MESSCLSLGSPENTMATGSTIHTLAIELSDSDRNVYQSLELRVARHSSETAEFMLARILAFCLEY